MLGPAGDLRLDYGAVRSVHSILSVSNTAAAQPRVTGNSTLYSCDTLLAPLLTDTTCSRGLPGIHFTAAMAAATAVGCAAVTAAAISMRLPHVACCHARAFPASWGLCPRLPHTVIWAWRNPDEMVLAVLPLGSPWYAAIKILVANKHTVTLTGHYDDRVVCPQARLCCQLPWPGFLLTRQEAVHPV